MINEDFKIEKKEASESKPIQPGIYTAQLHDVNVEERPTYDTKNLPEDQQKMEKIFNFEFRLLEGESNGESLVGKPVWRNFVPTYLYISPKNGKNALYNVVEAMLKRELTPEDEAKFEAKKLNQFIGKQVLLGIKNEKKGEKVYNNITEMYPVKQELPPLQDQQQQTTQHEENVQNTMQQNPAMSEDEARYEEIKASELPF